MKKTNKHPLAAFREERGLRSSQVAEELNISRQSLFRIENGDQNPSVDLIKRIVTFTEGKVSASDLVEAA